MNIAVIGLGSMGKRRIRLLKELYPEFSIYGVDSRPDRIKEAAESLQIQCFPDINDVPKNCDCSFVCTSPLSHASIISDCLSRGWHVFTEMNLVDDRYDENIKLAKQNGRRLFLSSTFFYRDEPKYIRSRIDSERKWNYVYHIGQYLPDWHPWENYKSYFIGDNRTNGCREIMAIELPWLTAAFGDITRTHVQSDKMTNLEKKEFFSRFIERIELDPEEKDVTKCIRSIKLMFPVEYVSYRERNQSPQEQTVETVVLLRRE